MCPADLLFLRPNMASLLPGSPCHQEHISIVINLGFLGILLLQLLAKVFRLICKDRHKVEDEGAKSYPVALLFGLSYKTSIACSAVLFCVHSTKLLLLLNNKYKSQCGSKLQPFSAEIIQFLAWAAMFVVLLWIIPKRRQVRIPWVLRAWWLCSFLMSTICIALDAYARSVSHGNLELQNYANFFALSASAVLAAISIRGKTGLVLVVSGEISEPLLNRKSTDNGFKAKRDSPYGNASLIQLVTFSWLNPLFSLGFKKPLEQEAVPDVDIKDSAEFLSHCFDEALNSVKENGRSATLSIYKAIYFFIRKKAAINAILAVISAAASYVGPYLINDFVTFLTEKSSRSLESGYLLALAFFGAKMVESIAYKHSIFGARQLGLRLRAALISHIYKKGLVLSSRSHRSRTTGEIINYISVDIQRITDFIWYLNIICMLPIQISLAIFILHTTLGLGSLASLAAVGRK